MTMRSWLRQMFSRSATRAISKAPRRTRLGVEVLEGRLVPSTFTVMNTLDDGSAGSLRWAVTQANTTPGADTIAFDSTAFSTPQTITLTGGQLELSDAATTTISGPAAGVTISGNGASRVFAIDSGTSAALAGLTITGGRDGSGGGLFNSGTATLTDCTVSGNTAFGNGGGLYTNLFASSTLTNCTVSGNTAGSGGGLGNFFDSTTTLTNCTVSGNSAGFGGGGVYNFAGTNTLTNCTVSGNSAGFAGGGLYPRFGGPTTLTNTILAGNSAALGNDLAYFVNVSGSNNLIGTGGSGGLSDGVDGNLVGVADPLLAPLGNYGGPTQTMPLLPGSPAIDAGATAGAAAADQRGLGRFGGVDIGAFESQGFTLAAAPGSSSQSAAIGTAFAPLAVTVTANNPAEPVDGGGVRFAASPAANGATAIFLEDSAVVANGQADGLAMPNNVLGSYTVATTSPGSPVTFALTNAGQVFSVLAVNTTSDSLLPGAGLLSLREAVAFANTAPAGGPAITFDPTAFASTRTIALSGTQLELSQGVTITGPAAGVTINGGGASRGLQIDAGVTASLSNLTLTGGSAASGGGGLLNNGTATLTNCTVSGNTALSPGGPNQYSSFGGGVLNNGTVTLTDCTLSGNSATYDGGGLENDGTVTLTNCTVSGNSATFGGGVYNQGAATLTNCTVSGNSAGENGCLSTSYRGTTALTNTIVAGNSASYGGGDVSGSVSGNNNLIGTGGSGGLTNGVNGNLVGVINPLLAPLGNYGGSTQTMPLLPGSPAIDAGATAGAAAADQRGLGRFGGVDIGAFESQGFTLAAAPGSSPQSAAIGSAFAPLAVVLTANNPVEPINGTVVHFTATSAANGATAILFATSAVMTNGQAAVGAMPSNALGSYTVVATVPGSSATFALTNAGKAFAALAVNTTSDAIAPGAGLLSLREAVAFANSAPSGDSTISFDKKVFAKSQTITLTGTQFELNRTNGTVTIAGPAAGVSISGGGLSRVFQVDAGVTASLSKLTITGGSATDGAGLANCGTVTLSSCTVSGNTATSGGGGLSNSGTAALISSSVSGNAANDGGGLSNSGAATLTNSTVSGNTAASGGGGLSNSGMATLTGCTVSGNTAAVGGGISNGGTLKVISSTVLDNQVTAKGGGISTTGGSVTLTSSVIKNNKVTSLFAAEGGGISSESTLLSLTNCTVSANQASGVTTAQGGGVYAIFSTVSVQGGSVNGNQASGATAEGGGVCAIYSTVNVQNGTVSSNQANGTSLGEGGGVYSSGGSLSLSNSKVKGNKATTSGDDVFAGQ